jgi:hypothetical protein
MSVEEGRSRLEVVVGNFGPWSFETAIPTSANAATRSMYCRRRTPARGVVGSRSALPGSGGTARKVYVKLNSIPVGDWDGTLVLLPPLSNEEVPEQPETQIQRAPAMGAPFLQIFLLIRYSHPLEQLSLASTGQSLSSRPPNISRARARVVR